MGQCNSNPISGCTDTQTVYELQKWTTDVELKLGQLIVKKGEIVTNVHNCNINLGNLFDEIIDKTVTLKENGEECCEALQDLLDDIIEDLENKTHHIVVNTTTTTQESTPTTTEESNTTTEELSTTTTQHPVYNSRMFNYEDSYLLLCLEENEIELFYEGIFGIGTIVYTDEGHTLFTGADYIKRTDSVVIFSVNGSGVVTDELEYQCE